MRAALILASCFAVSLASAQTGQPAAALNPHSAAPGLAAPAEPNRTAETPKAKPVAKAKPKPAPSPMPLTRVVAKDDPRPTIYPGAVDAIDDAAERYRRIAESGGWPMLPTGIILKPGSTGEAVLTLRQRLIREGDLDPAQSDNPAFDPGLTRGVKQFQARHGFAQTGIVGTLTLRALRVPAHERYQALVESARRLRIRQIAFGQRYVVVNIPSASVEAISAGEVERRHIAVVGKADRPSPEVETRITNVNFNPTWTVPVSIIKKDIIPKMRDDPQYLAKSKIRIFGASGAEIDPARIDWNTERATAFTLRQDPGAGNSLGQIRIDMPNREAVYMHDTPSKRLFLRDDRFHSSGCVRVENVRDFVAWLLRPTPKSGGDAWDRPDIDDILKSDTRKDVRLKESVPVIWAYLTGYVTPDGQVHFRDDVYGLDQVAILTSSADPAPLNTANPHEKRPKAIPSHALPARSSPMLETGSNRVLYPRPPGGLVQRLDP